MTRTEQVIENALAAVAASRAAREKDEERRARIFGRIQTAAVPKVVRERGYQLSLKLDS